MVSMLSMEAVQNIVDYHLMGGVVDLRNLNFGLQQRSLHALAFSYLFHIITCGFGGMVRDAINICLLRTLTDRR